LYGVINLTVTQEVRNSHFGRVVKAWDLKSHGVTRAGSNPADDVLFTISVK
jgi:hypothetical protein